MLRAQPWLRLWALAATLAGLAAAANAHPMPAGQGTLNVVGQRVYFAVSLATADFPAIGTAPNEPLKMAAQFERSVVLRDANAVARWKEVLVFPATHDDPDHVMAMAVAEFAQPPQTLAVQMGMLGPQEVITLRATRTQDGTPGPKEVGMVSSAKPQFVFFAPWWQRLAAFAQEGFEHIMGGWDHLLFLVALLATGIALRRWAVLLTGFTVAHGLTFGLASLGWVQAPASLVEPAIAASIALVACMHLLGVRMRLRWELALVMALGLIHGLGFASALQSSAQGESALVSAYPVLGIVGFNLGVEAGQLVVAVLLYALVRGLQHLSPQERHPQWQRGLSAIAATVACYWLFQRI